MARRMRELDWASTDLGPAEKWPENLRVAVSLCLTSRFPIVVWWGPKRSVLYNDAYIPFLGETKHPRVLGQPGYDCWQEIWPTIGPMLDSVYATGKATWSEDQLFFFARKLPREEVHVRFSYGPILSCDGRKADGVFCPCTEITEEIVGARRLETLRRLSADATLKASVHESCEEAAGVLASNPHDIPFAAIYLVGKEGDRAELKGVAGFGAAAHPFPRHVSVSDHDDLPWRVASVLRTRAKTEIDNLLENGSEIRAGPWNDAIQRAILLPIFRATQAQLSAVILLGVSARLPLDEAYRAFIDLIAGHVNSAIAKIEAHEAERREESRVEGLTAVANDFLTKPFHASSLLASVAARLEIARLSREAVRSEHELRVLAEASEKRSVDELAVELAAMKRLHELSTRLLASNQFQPLVEEILSATVALQNADFGVLQLYHPETEQLEIVAQRGFDPEQLKRYTLINKTAATSCARALRLSRRVIVEDVTQDPASADSCDTAAELGYRAETSTPLFSHGGRILGMMTTHFRVPHRPSERDLRFTDLYARQAAEAIERKQAEDALRVSEERFRRYFELGLIGMALTSPSKGILEVNDEICRILGYPRDELLRKTWAEMTHPDDLANDVVHFKRVLAGELDGYSIEKRWIRKDGRIIDSIMAAKCQRRADGSIDYFVGLVLDTTERKRAEEELRRSEAYLAEAQRLSHTGSGAWNVVTGEVFWSDETYRVYGFEPGKVTPTGELFFNIVHPADRNWLQDEFKRVVAEKCDYDLRFRIVRPDGVTRWIHSVGHPLFSAVGEVTDVLGTVMDITERKDAEEKLAASERRFRLLAETLPQHVWSYHRDGSASYFNRRWLDYTGIPWEEARRAGGHEIVHHDDAAIINPLWRKASAERKPFEAEIRLRRKDGEYRRFFVQGAPFLSDTGELLEWHGTNTDIEDRKQAEEALQKAQSKLEKVAHVSAMGELAAAIAHEINQPLGAIVNNGSYCLQLLGRPDAEAKKRAALKDIVNDANRASAIIRRIRGLTNGVAPEITTLNFRDLIAETAKLTQRTLADHGIEMRTRVAKHLPDFHGDRVQLQQVLLNLVINAIEAMSGVEKTARLLTIRVTPTTLDGERAIAVTVADTGVGFEPEAAERVFDAFYSTKPGGMGMGLRISRSIVESYGGRLSAKRNAAKGATFSLVLPASSDAR